MLRANNCLGLGLQFKIVGAKPSFQPEAAGSGCGFRESDVGLGFWVQN